MKVLLINGSPRAKGNTYLALCEVAKTLNEDGIETEIFHIGAKPVRGCIACGKCDETRRCIFDDDTVNTAIDKIRESDGLIVGSPVYYSGMTGALKSFLDRVFCAMKCLADENDIQYKPAACVVACRRGGATATFEQINKYFTIASMPVISSDYWNQIHGFAPGEANGDIEGMHIMRVLGHNMAWILKCIDLGKKNGINPPVREPRVETNFIREL